MISAINFAQQTPQIQMQQNIAFRGLKKEDLLQLQQNGNLKKEKISFGETQNLVLRALTGGSIILGGILGFIASEPNSIVSPVINIIKGGTLGGIAGFVGTALIMVVSDIVIHTLGGIYNWLSKGSWDDRG